MAELYELEKGAEKGYPKKCPITGLGYFMELTSLYGKDVVPTYGGPFDSYTIPVKDGESGEWVRYRYDHDAGTWIDGGESLDERMILPQHRRKGEIKITQQQINEWRHKAEKWDKLNKQIGKYYNGENNEPPEKNGDLCDIGEAAATAFGYL